jgi:cell division septum initiation protein DivIVA
MSEPAKRYYKTLSDNMHLQAENARLKAEVERLDAVIESHKDAGLRILAILDEERRLTKHLKAEVERLTEAGDAFYESEIGYYGEEIINDPKHHSGQMCRDWNAAKEGKPQP